VSQRRIDAALFLANHPARNGLDSPHEFRAWRDAESSIAVGFEGAPGHQAAGLPAPTGAGSARGFYGQSPSANSWPGFPFPGTPLGGTLRVAKGAKVEMVISIDLATGLNWSQFVPKLARVDVIAGAITGPAADRDAMTAPGTKVVQPFEVGAGPRVTYTYQFGPVENAFYTRLRGTDGNRGAVGYLGADVDPVGPAIDAVGNADPWLDLWFYANPIFVIPR
jgi:hypothetical protein